MLKYRAEIDGLRAFAVIPVILFHAEFELFSGGFVGVDIFFVISGYLITTILITDLENNRFSLLNFYEKRARRLLPTLFVMILVCIPFAWMLMLPDQMKDFSQSLVAVSFFASNVLFWLKSGYFAATEKEKPLLHTWSLAVEEQYYLFFPIFLLLAWRYGKNRTFWIIVVLAAVSLILSEWGWRNKASANFYLAPTRAWELFAGALSAFYVQKKGVQKNELLSLIGLTVIIFSIFAYDESTPFPSVYALVPVVGVVLLILFASKTTVVARWLTTKVFVGIGLISYSTYLWHQPLFSFARLASVERVTPITFAGLSVLSLVIGYFSWKYIEQPTRNKELVGKKVIFSISIVGILIFSAIGFVGHTTQGFGNYLLKSEELFVFQSRDVSGELNCSKEVSECINPLGLDDSKRILLIGDSNAYHFSKGLKEVAEQLDYSYVQLTMGGCFPLAKFYRHELTTGFNRRCLEFNQTISDQI